MHPECLTQCPVPGIASVGFASAHTCSLPQGPSEPHHVQGKCSRGAQARLGLYLKSCPGLASFPSLPFPWYQEHTLINHHYLNPVSESMSLRTHLDQLVLGMTLAERRHWHDILEPKYLLPDTGHKMAVQLLKIPALLILNGCTNRSKCLTGTIHQVFEKCRKNSNYKMKMKLSGHSQTLSLCGGINKTLKLSINN